MKRENGNCDLVSIIVPVHNVERYLERCLDSVVGQTYRNLEILIVENGSTDGSPQICDRYAEADDRIKVFHIGKAGLSRARNFGIEHASGAYYAFADSDDFIELDMIEKLYKAIVDSGRKAVMCGFVKEEESGRLIRKCSFDHKTTFDAEKYLDYFYNKKADVVLWNRLYKAEVFEGLQFPEGHYFEDIWKLPEMVERCGEICVIPDVLYHYRKHLDSIIHTYSYAIIEDSLNSKEALALWTCANYPKIGDSARLYLLKVCTGHWYMLNLAEGNSDKIRRLQKRARESVIRLYRECGGFRINKKVSKKMMASLTLLRLSPAVAKHVYIGIMGRAHRGGSPPQAW